MASHIFDNSAYFYYVQIPWIAVNFQVLVVTTARRLLGQQLPVWSRTLELLIRVVLGAICSSAVMYGFRLVFGDHKAISLFVSLGLGVGIAVVTVRPSWKVIAAGGLFLLPLLQLYYSLLYSVVFEGLPWSQNYTIWLCYSYPVIIGLIKMAMQSTPHSALDERYFGAEDLLEVISFGLADLPYRFLYYKLSTWRSAVTLFAIKFSYKVRHSQTYGYWITIHFRKLLSRFSLKARKMRKLHPNKVFFAVPGAAKVYEEAEFLQRMAMKFFLHELMDCFDILSMLVILVVTKGADSGIGAEIPVTAFWRYVEQIVIELALEIVFISLTRLLIQRKFPTFQPSQVRKYLERHAFLGRQLDASNRPRRYELPHDLCPGATAQS